MQQLTIDGAIQQLRRPTTNIGCGAIHESKKASFGPIDCPIRLRGNTACCHPYLIGSAAGGLENIVDLLDRVQQQTNQILVNVTQLRTTLDSFCRELVILDRTLAEKHSRIDSLTVVKRSASNQVRLGHRIQRIRDELLAALELLRPFVQEIS